jgi:hypothetical protein
MVQPELLQVPDQEQEQEQEQQQAQQQSHKSHKFFKSAIPIELIHGFIRRISYKIPNTHTHLIDLNAYKKAVYCADAQTVSLLAQFCNELLPHYCKEKQVFLTRKMSYNNMNTILRQVCRHCAIVCKSERKYDKSKTQIVYHVVLDEADEADEEANKAYAEKAEQTEKADEPPI